MCTVARRALCFASLIMAAPSLLTAQATATITGTIRDITGAVVPQANVTATNTGTNLSRSTVTDGVGQYVIPLLVVGGYQVRVEKEGFAPFMQTDVLLQANTQVRVDAVLQIRSTTQEVTVSATPTLVQTNSATMVQVVERQRVADLPLNGRNVTSLIALAPGVATRNVPSSVAQTTSLGEGSYYTPVAINGARAGSMNFLLDNADHNEAHTNMPRPFPNVDAIEEFSVQASSFDAQYGRGVGGVVNLVTKAGTNDFHGSVFEFLRNYQMNAANFFSGRDALKRNQFGGALGGPIRKDGTFFFVSYQGLRQRSGSPGALATVPSAAMKEGDFSEWLKAGGVGAIHDPLDPTTYFPGNRIPTSRFDPVSAKLLQWIPTSSDPSYQVRYAEPAQPVTDNQGVVRLDHSLTERQRLSGRYFVFRYDRSALSLPDNILFDQTGSWGYSQSLSVNHTFSISSRWLHNATFSYSWSAPQRKQAPEPKISLMDLGARVKTVPQVNMMVASISGWSGISWSDSAEHITRSLQFTDSASYATGHHNLRFGGDLRRYRSGFFGFYRTGGQASFTGQFLSDKGKQNAGNAYAEFLLGVAGSWWQISTQLEDMRHQNIALYIQDDVRVTDKLTVNLGLRWDPHAGMQDHENRDGTFVPGQRSKMFPNAPPGIIFYGDDGIEKGVIPTDWNNWAPRVGLVYQLARRTVVRAAYGIFYDEFQSQLYNTFMQSLPWVNQLNTVGPLSFSDPYAGRTVLDPVNYTPDPNVVFPDYLNYSVPSPDMCAGYLQNWNFVLERQLRDDLLVRAAYVGSKGTHLLNRWDWNPGIYAPGATAANINARRPYARIGALSVAKSSANSSYNSLQLTVQKRYSKGFSILASYTASKSLDTNSDGTGSGTGPDPFNLRNNRGPSDFDVAQRFVVSGVWAMPRLQQAHPVLRSVLGGWQSNGIFTAETGTPMTITSGVDNDFNGVSGDFADYLGGEWRLSKDPSKEEKILRWFDTSVFARNTVGTIGTARRGQLRAPGSWNLDYSLFKNVSLTERYTLQFRGEFFNVLNHANLGAPSTSVNSVNFGRITSASGPRIVQLAIKLTF